MSRNIQDYNRRKENQQTHQKESTRHNRNNMGNDNSKIIDELNYYLSFLKT